MTQHRADLGPAIRRQRGDVEVERVAEGSVGEAKRAKVAWAPERLQRAGKITVQALEACRRFRAAYEVAEGARDGMGESLIARGGSPPWSRLPTAEARIAARQEYRQAEAACGIRASAALSWCVLRDGQIVDWAANRRIKPAAAAGYLLAAIERLDEFYAVLDGDQARLRRPRLLTTPEFGA